MSDSKKTYSELKSCKNQEENQITPSAGDIKKNLLKRTLKVEYLNHRTLARTLKHSNQAATKL